MNYNKKRSDMKKICLAICAMAVMMTSCGREESPVRGRETNEWGEMPITFSVGGLRASVASKVDAINSTEDLPFFNVMAVKYEGTDVSVLWKARARRMEGDRYVCERGWPRTMPEGTSYAFAATNAPDSCLFLLDADGQKVISYCIPDCSADWLVGGTDAHDHYVESLFLSFSHVLSRIAGVYVDVPEGYDVTIDSLSVTASTFFSYREVVDNPDLWGRPATYDLQVSGYVNGDGNTVTTEPVNDVWVFPSLYGGVKLTVGYTVSRGEWSNSVLTTATVSVLAGEVSNIILSISPVLGFSVELDAWRTGTDKVVKL